MKKKFACRAKSEYWILTILPILLVSLSGCGRIGEKSTSMAIVYGVIAVVSLVLLGVYSAVIKKKNVWFLVLFASIFIVNTGYFALSISQTLEEALLANRVAYLGSVFLPLSMLMLMMDVCNLKYRMWVPIVLLVISFFVFLVAASPGYLDIYYKTVSIVKVDGVAVLKKTYGSWHSLYLYYLITYFALIVFMAVRGAIKKKVRSNLQSIVLSGVVFLNICVWLLGQLIEMKFEFLSVSYIISEFFLLFSCLMIQEEELKTVTELTQNSNSETLEEERTEEKKQIIESSDESCEESCEESTEECRAFAESLRSLTPTERTIYNHYLEGKTTKEVLELLNIKENTLKYHNKNIYGKLNVSSRKQLIEIAKKL